MSATEEIERLVACDDPDPHALLGAHPHKDGVVIRAFRPGAERVRALVAGGEPVTLRLLHPAGVFEGVADGRVAAAGVRARGRVPARERARPRPLCLPAHARRARPAPRGRGAPRAALREARGARARDRRHTGHELRRVGPERALGQRRRRLQRVGRAPSPDALTGQQRGSGSSSYPVPGRAPATSSRSARRTASCCSGPTRSRSRPRCRRRRHRSSTAAAISWRDEAWIERRRAADPLKEPMSIYEVHLPSWRLKALEDNRSLTYLELADELAAYVSDLGFTHVELLPVMAHPFGGSWGYQVTSYFAPTPLLGSPDDLREFIDRMHQAGIGVILDWVPAHFPRDEWALARFDGTRAVRARGSPPRASPGLGHARVQLRAQRGAQLPHRQRRLLAAGVPRGRAAGGRRGVDALPRLLAQRGGVDPQPLRRPRGPRGDRLPARAQRGAARPRAGRRVRPRRSPPPGPAFPGRPTSAASGSA